MCDPTSGLHNDNGAKNAALFQLYTISISLTNEKDNAMIKKTSKRQKLCIVLEKEQHESH
jgi:hypothetical protein